MNFTVSSQLTGNIFCAEVTVADSNQFTQYAYYLCHYGTTIQKQIYIDSPKFSFTLSKPGKYYIKVFVRVKNADSNQYIIHSKVTKTYWYYPPELYDEYRSFLNTDSDFHLRPLPYQPYEYPYQDLFLVYDTSEQTEEIQKKLRRMGHTLGLRHTQLNPQAMLLSQTAVYHEGKVDAAFSGIGRTSSRLIYGMSDIDSLSCVDELSQQVGCFSFLRADKEQILLGTDYFGTDKLYYLQDNSLFLVSNRVHLLILAMQALNIPRSPNLPHIYAYLTDTFYTQQNFTQALNIHGLLVLRSDSRIRIHLPSGKVSVEKTALYYALSSYVPYDQDRYDALIDDACNEIVDNLKIALEHPAFDQYVVHITGGLDSRLVFSALTKLPQYKDKVFAHTDAPSTSNPDLTSVVRILSKKRYSFGTPKFDLSHKTTYTDGFYRALSTTLGVTAEHSSVPQGLPYYKTCIFPGAFGDYLCRPYYSKQLRGTAIGSSTVSDEDFWSYLIDHYTGFSIFDVHDAFSETFVKECLALPGTTNLDKLDNHYLYYRNGLHFSYSNRFGAKAPFWGALQSKSLLLLKAMTSSLNLGIKVHLDLIRHLDPEIASVQFSNATYEKERAQLNARFGGYPVCQEYDEALLADILNSWLQNKEAMKSSPQLSLPPQENPYGKETSLAVFRALAHALALPEEIGCSIYYHLKNDSVGTTLRKHKLFLSKLYSLYYELL